MNNIIIYIFAAGWVCFWIYQLMILAGNYILATQYLDRGLSFKVLMIFTGIVMVAIMLLPFALNGWRII